MGVLIQSALIYIITERGSTVEPQIVTCLKHHYYRENCPLQHQSLNCACAMMQCNATEEIICYHHKISYCEIVNIIIVNKIMWT